MSPKQIEYMKRLTFIHEHRYVLWWNSGVGLKKVSRIGKVEDEPGPVAFLMNERFGLNYVALDNCTPDDFMVTSNDIALWPD